MYFFNPDYTIIWLRQHNPALNNMLNDPWPWEIRDLGKFYEVYDTHKDTHDIWLDLNTHPINWNSWRG